MLTTLLVALLAAAPTIRPSAEDCIRQEREAAKTWGMHAIAVIEAQHHDVQDAKRTLTQIGPLGLKRPADVTGVRFHCGQIFYDHPPGMRVSFAALPPRPSPALPPDYLAPDPNRGEVVEFHDEHDAFGVRVTTRRYADGSIIIETPHRRAAAR